MINGMNKAQRIGVLGGTFDPPHMAHLNIAFEARDQLNLDRVFWTITPEPPHKRSIVAASLEDRVAMVSLMIAPHPFFSLCIVDVERPGPYYAADTLKIIADQNKGAELIYIIGSDLLSSFASWVRVNDLLSTCSQIGIVSREGGNYNISAVLDSFPEEAPKFREISIPVSNLSSREIREKAKSGASIQKMVTASVSKYIQEHHLYK